LLLAIVLVVAPARYAAAESASLAHAPRVADVSRAVPAPPADFNTYDGGWIRFAYHPSIRERVQRLIADADEARHELRSRLDQAVLENVVVHVARTSGEMASLVPRTANVPEYASGLAFPGLDLVLLTVHPSQPGAHHDLTEIFRHELAHLALSDAVGPRPIPRWFNEGFAVFASGEGSLVRLQTLWSATLAERLLSLGDLERTFPADAETASVAYAQAADIVRFLVRRHERHRFRSLIERYRRGQSFDRALEDAYGVDRAMLEYEWRQDVAKRYTFWPVLFSGSLVWVLAVGLFVWGYRRRRRRNQETLARWDREQAVEDARQLRGSHPAPGTRVHIVLARGEPPPVPEDLPVRVEPEVPKVEHDGRWHTLH
jgi:hypothetical protein